MQISFTPIGNQITLRINLSDLSQDDKAHLLHTLLTESGIFRKMSRASLDELEKLWAGTFRKEG